MKKIGSCHLIQAAGTPGRAILEGRSPSKAAIHRLTGYSAHADQNTLAAWVAAMPDPRARSAWSTATQLPNLPWPKG